MHREIFDRSPTTEANRKDVEVDAGYADQLILIRAGFEQRHVFVVEDLRGALDGAVAIPIRGTAAGRVEEPLQPRYEFGLGTSLELSDMDAHRIIILCHSSGRNHDHACAHRQFGMPATAQRSSPTVTAPR